MTSPLAPSRRLLLRFQRNRCYLCGKGFGALPKGTPDRRRLQRARRITEDHVFPKSAGWTLFRNKLLAHAACNAAKDARKPYPCEVLYLAAVNARADALRAAPQKAAA